MNKELFMELYKKIENVKVIDTHEHLQPESERILVKLDFFNLFETYIFSDCISAGLDYEKMRNFVDDKNTPLDLKWHEFKKYWEKARNTIYAEVVMVVIKDLLGFDDLNDDTFLAISNKLKEVNVKGWYKKVLKDICLIEKCVLDLDRPSIEEQTEVDLDIFSPVVRFDHYLRFNKKSTISFLEKNTGISIHSMDHLLKSLNILFSKVLNSKACGIKIDFAYERTINIEKFTKSEAEADLNYLLKETSVRVPWLDEKTINLKDVKRLQDFCVHYILNFAEENNLPVQVHTGLQEGIGNYVVNSNPLLMINLLLEYKNINFSFLHGGYPFMRELITIIKNFRNAYLDMSWLHIISRKAARDLLEEAIEAIPLNKIFGFGGDFHNIEGTYGHLKIARQNITFVLNKLIEEERIIEKRAINIAKKILYENPREFFNL